MADEIIKVLDDLSQRFGIAVDWSSQNMMPYLQTLGNKLVNYKIAFATLWVVLGVICLVLALLLWKDANKYSKDKHPDDYYINSYCDQYYARICIGVCFLLVGLLLILINAHTIILGLTFPEKIIFEEVKDMLRNYR